MKETLNRIEQTIAHAASEMESVNTSLAEYHRKHKNLKRAMIAGALVVILTFAGFAYFFIQNKQAEEDRNVQAARQRYELCEQANDNNQTVIELLHVVGEVLKSQGEQTPERIARVDEFVNSVVNGIREQNPLRDCKPA